MSTTPRPHRPRSSTELAGYPQHWEADVLLVDGGVVHLRPSGTGDGDAIRAMHGRMSARTLFLRYFTRVTEVTDEQVALFTDTDYVSRVGLVAELGGEVIAAGTYHRNTLETPPPPRSRLSSRTRNSVAALARSCWNTSRRPPKSGASAGSPPKCSARTNRW